MLRRKKKYHCCLIYVAEIAQYIVLNKYVCEKKLTEKNA